MYSDMSKRSSSTPMSGRKLLGNFGLADAGRTREQIAADRLFRFAQARARHLDGRRQRRDRLVLAEHDTLQIVLEVATSPRHRTSTPTSAGCAPWWQRSPRSPCTLIFFLRLPSRHQHLRGAGLVDHVDRLVRQLAVVDVLRRQLDRRLDRVVGVLDLVDTPRNRASGPSGS